MLTTLEKIIKWCFENGIEITVRNYKEDGLKKQIEIELSKDGKKEMVRIYDWAFLGNKSIMLMVEEKAFELCLTRLVLT